MFTGLLSVAFLNKELRYFHWLGIGSVIAGLIIVGISDFLSEDSDEYTTNGIITGLMTNFYRHGLFLFTFDLIGDLLIIAAQVVTATQMVVEEKFLTGYDVPALKAVGWEGINFRPWQRNLLLHLFPIW